MSSAEPISKAEFARQRGVSRAAVTGYIASGKISGEALVVQDGREMIRPDLAEQQLNERLHAGQRLGALAAGAAGAPIGGGPIGLQVQNGDQLRYQRSAADLKEVAALRAKMEMLERNGSWVRSAEVQPAWSRRLSELLILIEAEFPDMADLVIKAAREGGRREVMVALRQGFRALRTKVAARMGAEAAALPETAAPQQADE